MTESEPESPAPACSECGRELRPEALFCDNCGHPVEPVTIKCPNCGETDHRPGATYCLTCGSALMPPGPPPAGAATEAPDGAESEPDEPVMPRFALRPLALLGGAGLVAATFLPWLESSRTTAWDVPLQLLTGNRPDPSDDWLTLGLVVTVAGGMAALAGLTKLRFGPHRWIALTALAFVVWFGDWLGLFTRHPGDALQAMGLGVFIAAAAIVLILVPQWQPQARGIRFGTGSRWKSVAVIALAVAVLASSAVFADVSALSGSATESTAPPTTQPEALPVGDEAGDELPTVAAPGPAPPWVPGTIEDVDPNGGFAVEGANGVLYGYADGTFVATDPESGTLWEGGVIAGRLVDTEFILSGEAPPETIEWATAILDANPWFERGGRGWVAPDEIDEDLLVSSDRVDGGFWTVDGETGDTVLVHSNGGEYVFVEAAEDHAWIIDDEAAVMLVPQGETLSVAGALTATEHDVVFEPSPVADDVTLATAMEALDHAFVDEVGDRLVMQERDDGSVLVARSGGALASADLSDIKFWFGCGWCNKAKKSVVNATKTTVNAGTNGAKAVGGKVKDGVVTGTGVAVDVTKATGSAVKTGVETVARETKEQAVRTGNGIVSGYEYARSGAVTAYERTERATVRAYEYGESQVISLGEVTLEGLQTGWVYVKKGSVAAWRGAVTVVQFIAAVVWAWFDHAMERKCSSSRNGVAALLELALTGSPGPGPNPLGTGRPVHPASGYRPEPGEEQLLDLARAWLPPIQLSRDEQCGEIIRVGARVFPYAADGALIDAPPYLADAERVEIVYTVFFRYDGGRFCGLVSTLLFGGVSFLFQDTVGSICHTHAGDNEGIGIALIRSDRSDGRCGLTQPSFELVGARSSGHSDEGPEWINRVTISDLDAATVAGFPCPARSPAWRESRSDSLVAPAPTVPEATTYKVWSSESKHAMYWDRNACEREIFSTAILLEDQPEWVQFLLPQQGAEECEGGRDPFDLSHQLELFTTAQKEAMQEDGWCVLDPTQDGFPPLAYYQRGGPNTYFQHNNQYKAYACQTRGKPWWQVEDRYRIEDERFTNPDLIVPNVEGMRVGDAADLLERYHLGLAIVDVESVAFGDSRHDTIKEQVTRAGTTIRGIPTGDEDVADVRVVVYVADKHEVPDFTGMTLEEAEAVAGSKYQIYDGGPYDVGSNDELVGVIATQIPAPGTLIDAGAIVTVYIGESSSSQPPPGPPPTPTAPPPAPNRPPVAVDDSARDDTTIDPPEVDTWQPVYVLSNDSDPDGDPLRVVSLRCADEDASCDHIQWRIHPSGEYIEVKALTTSPDSYEYRVLEYTISDGRGGTDKEKVYLDIFYV